MKKLSTVTAATLGLVALLSALAVSCSGGRGYGWPSLGRDLDRLNAELDSLYFRDALSPEAATPLLRQMDSVATAMGRGSDRAVKARLCYWRSRAYTATMTDSLPAWLDYAREATDSASDPYGWARIDVAYYQTFGAHLQRYVALKNALNYFIVNHDNRMQFMAQRALSLLYIGSDDLDNYLLCAKEIERLCRSVGADTLVAKSKMNYALYHILHGDSIEASCIIDSLLRNPYVQSDSTFLGRLYVNIANLRREPDSLRRALEISPIFDKSPGYRYTILFSMAKMYDELGQRDKCDSMLAITAPVVLSNGNHESRMLLHSILAQRSKEAGDYADAVGHLELCLGYKDSMHSTNPKASVANYDRREEVNRLEREHAQEQKLYQTRWMIGLAVVLLAMLSVAYLLNDRRRKSQIARLRVEAEMSALNLSLEKEKRIMQAMGVAITERSNVMNDVADTLNSMRQEGRISGEDRALLVQKIKVSQSVQQEWDDFQQAHEKVHPDFLRQLTVNYPGLSDGDIRLALYLAAGLTSKQIALKLHIQPNSIKKSRQRLRRHMGLDPEASLEEVLRNLHYTTPPPAD